MPSIQLARDLSLQLAIKMTGGTTPAGQNLTGPVAAFVMSPQAAGVGTVGVLTAVTGSAAASVGAPIASATEGSSIDAPPAGYAYMVDSQGRYLVNAAGAYMIGRDTSAPMLSGTASVTMAAPAASSFGTSGASETPAGMLGTNLESLIDYTSNNWATVNVFKASRPFLSGTKGGAFYDGRSLTLDSDGYPTSLLSDQRAQSIILLNAGYPTGQYIITWTGVGTLNVAPSVPGSSIVSTAANRIVINLPSSTSDGVYIAIDTTTPGNHVRNIDVRHSSLEFSTEIWHPAFVADISYYSTLRFMDLQRTNDSPLSSWANRCKLTSAHWSTDAGAPVEALCNLANKVNANPWFCMPHLADDNFVTQFATVVNAQLDTHLVPYVECSNEVWNFQFGQSQYAIAQAAANTGRYLSDGAGYIHWHSARSKSMHVLWNAAYSRDFVRVLGTQAAQSYLLEKALTFEGNGAHFDAVAIAPYFGLNIGYYDAGAGGLGNTTVNQTESEVLTVVETTQMAQVIDWVDSHKEVLEDYPAIDLIAYEGGQHIVRIGTAGSTTDAQLDARLISIQDNPRMGAFYTLYLEQWKTMVPGGLMCHFLHTGSWSQYGSWGARERLSDPVDASQPKALALYNFALANGGDVEEEPPPGPVSGTAAAQTGALTASASGTSGSSSTLLDITSIPVSFPSTPTGMRTGKWQFTYTPSVSSASMPAVWHFMIGSSVDGASIVVGGASNPGDPGHIGVYNGSYGQCVYRDVTFSAGAPITITIDMPLQQVTLAGLSSGNGTFAASPAMAWAAGAINIGSDNNYSGGVYYGAPALPGTMSDIEAV